jgi:hypothetical protein
MKENTHPSIDNLPEMITCGDPLVIIPAEDWEEFEHWARAPAKEIPALRKLASMHLPSKE